MEFKLINLNKCTLHQSTEMQRCMASFLHKGDSINLSILPLSIHHGELKSILYFFFS